MDEISPNAESFSDEDATPGDRYYYAVAVVKDGNVGVSKVETIGQVEVIPPPAQPAGTVFAFNFMQGLSDIMGNHTATLRGGASIGPGGLVGVNTFGGVGISDSPSFIISGDFTVEWWGEFTGTQSAQFLGQYGNSDRSFNLETYDNIDLNFLLSTNAAYQGSNSLRSAPGLTTLKTAGQTHFAGVRHGNEMRMYLGGVNIGTRFCSVGPLHDSSRDLVIGAHQGVCTGARFVNGTALYSADFTPPAGP
ncbi:LamG-like jellyroll fold domain-containing protein [Halovulum sp. GXIMD14793]